MGHTPGHLIVVGVENKMAAGVVQADQSTQSKWRAEPRFPARFLHSAVIGQASDGSVFYSLI